MCWCSVRCLWFLNVKSYLNKCGSSSSCPGRSHVTLPGNTCAKFMFSSFLHLSCIDIPYLRICQHITFTRGTTLLSNGTFHWRYSYITAGHVTLTRGSSAQCFFPQNHYLTGGSHPATGHQKILPEFIIAATGYSCSSYRAITEGLDFSPLG